MSLNDFLQSAMSRWMRDGGPEDDIILSSRVRVARNFEGIPFPMIQSDQQASQVIELVRQAISSPEHATQIGEYEVLQCSNMDLIDRQVLVEKHLISRDLAEEQKHGAVALRKDEVVSVMINEEDHLRVQALMPGLMLREAWEVANALDDVLEQRIPYAYLENFGYLTACPTNVGTGIRASVMMHLPGLVLAGQINRMLAAVSQVGLAVRGLYGEGSEAFGNLFQVSNQITLGESEEEIIGNLTSVVNQLVDHERNARHLLIHENRVGVEDKVCRSFGILAYARRIDSTECLGRLSDVRLGIDLGIIKGVSAGILKELMVMTQPAFLQKYYKQELNPVERDIRRATLIRERLRIDDTEVQ